MASKTQEAFVDDSTMSVEDVTQLQESFMTPLSSLVFGGSSSSFQRYTVRDSTSEFAVEPAHWKSPGGIGDPDKELPRLSVDDLQEAALRGDCRLVQRLIQAGVPVNAPLRVVGGDEYLTLLHVLACHPDLPNGIPIACELIQAKANPNARSTYGSTPLMFACHSKNVVLAEVLLEFGADPHPVDDHGKTAMSYAVALGMQDISSSEAQTMSVSIVVSLHMHGANPDDGGLVPPIVEAIVGENDPAVTQLLELGAQSDGLCEALANKPLRQLKELIDGGANPFAMNEEGQDCMEVALERGDQDIVDMLRSYIADIQRSRSELLRSKRHDADVEYDQRQIIRRKMAKVISQGNVKPGRGSIIAKLFIDKEEEMEEAQEEPIKVRMRNRATKLLRHPLVQSLLTTNMLLALYLPDVWTILEMEPGGAFDLVLVVIFSVFAVEFLLSLFCHWSTYVKSFTFWTDVVGIASVPLDHTLVSGLLVAAFAQVGGGEDVDSLAVARLTKFVKISAKAARLSRLVKLIRFVPGLRQETDHPDSDKKPWLRKRKKQQGTAELMAEELNIKISVKVAVVVILMVVMMTLLEFFRYPGEDHSLSSWVHQLDAYAREYPDDLMLAVQDMQAFYETLPVTYSPFEVAVPFIIVNGGPMRIVLEGAAVPIRQADKVMYTASGVDGLSVSYNFRDSNMTEAIVTVCLITFIMMIVFVSAGFVTSTVGRIVLNPLKTLLQQVEDVARKIFDALESLALLFVKDHASKKMIRGTTLQDRTFQGGRIGSETELLKKVTASLSLLKSIAASKTPVDEFEQLGEAARGMFLDYSTLDASRRATVIKREDHELEEWRDDLAPLMDVIHGELTEAELSIEDFNNWELEIPEMSFMQRMALAQCLIVMYDSAPGFKDGRVKISKFVTHAEFVKALERGYDDDQEVPYTNWNHAVDVGHTLNQFFRLMSAEKYLARHERFAMMVAGLAANVGHFGTTNQFLRASSHPVSLVYNDCSCLEMMSCAKLFEILKKPGTDVLINFDKPHKKEIREVIVETILHTDMEKHSLILKSMTEYYRSKEQLINFITTPSPLQTADQRESAQEELQDFFWNADVKHYLRVWLVHLADISNPFKPWELCRTWAEMQFDEFYKQGDLERELKLGVQPLNDRVRTNLAQTQISYIKFFIIPAMTLSVKMLPGLGICEEYLWPNLDQWMKMWGDSKPDPDAFNEMVESIQMQHNNAHHNPGLEVHKKTSSKLLFAV